MIRVAALGLLAWLLACAPAVDVVPPPKPAPFVDVNEEVPLGRLPSDVVPTHYELELELLPRKHTYRGVVTIDVRLDKPRRVIWLHGNGLRPSKTTVTPKDGEPIAATYEQVDEGGVVKLTLNTPVSAGEAAIRIVFAADFGTNLNGLYRVVTKGHAYAFTQMEPVWTRKAFPCFNEPAFKTPWDVRLVVHKNEKAVANTAQIERKRWGGELELVTFATTKPMPTYLVAFAVGPLDIVTAPPIPPNSARGRLLPFRGVAAKGRGPELQYALDNTPGILKVLEEYFAMEYPYDKLDIIAVPDKGGAMENVGAITFREWLLLLDKERAPIQQKRAFAYVMAHELAHMWFGNLVTMPWWDDIWLNEAFATWMGYRAVHTWKPEHQANVSQLQGVHGAMASDSLVNARQIRQPVANNNDIHNAFDRITYRKGGGVLGMFERWMGPDVFRNGLRAYMKKHSHGSATADDLLAAFSEAAGKDVSTPFRTFLFQPGLPNIDVALQCEGDSAKLNLTQTRYLPLGSTGDPKQTWQVPVCVRYGDKKAAHEQCALITSEKATVALEQKGCPTWVLPNAGGVGYYQWSLDNKGFEAIAKAGLPHLKVPELMSFAKAVRGAFARGVLEADAAFDVLKPLAGVEHPAVATAPMSLLRLAQEWGGDQKISRHASRLYAPTAARLDWTPKPDESPETRLLRREVLHFLGAVGDDKRVRRRAEKLAEKYIGYGGDNQIHKDAVDPNLARIALQFSGEEADAELFEAFLFQFDNAAEEVVRGNLLAAVSSAQAPELAKRARALILNDGLKKNERMTPLWIQMGQRKTRDDTWRWLAANMTPLIDGISARRAGWLPNTATVFCSEEQALATDALFAPHLNRLAGGPRELRKALEQIRNCAAQKKAQLPGIGRMLQ